jgi:FlaA1/EpsC-like NDP-sugar epimerase
MRNRYVLLADLPIIILAALGAFVLRFDWFFTTYQRDFAFYAAAAVVIKPVVFYAFGLYSRYWRYASGRDLIAVVFAVVCCSVLMAIAVGAALSTGLVEQFARSVVFIDGLLTLVATGGMRAALRLMRESTALAGVDGRNATRRVLIVGAGDAGTLVAREMVRNPQLGMSPVGYVDDDPIKHGKSIYGLQVFGPIARLGDIVRAHDVAEVTIAMPSISGAVVRSIVEQCRAIGVPSRTIPGMYELLDGNVSVSRLRNVEIADLLRRSEVDWNSCTADYVTGRAVLVTGAGGSIGFELCRQVARRNPAQLVLLGHGENSLFDAHAALAKLFPAVKLRVVVADIRNDKRIGMLFRRIKPSVVFHAAAHKHVPLMEENPEEAISNNVFGTRNVVQAALDGSVERFVLISSDKAVSPSSLMGAAKRLAEAVVLDAARDRQRAFVVVRFGNVLGSRGSVVPTFKRQIEEGGPITITHPNMRRYFMTIPEAVHLVLEAGGMGKGGELFVLRMGEPIRIVDIAQDLVRLSGLALDEMPIVYTGIRPGEKIDESLWENHADVSATRHGDVVQVTEPDSWPAELRQVLQDLEAAVSAGDASAIDRVLCRAIPTFAPNRPRAVVPLRAATS